MVNAKDRKERSDSNGWKNMISPNNSVTTQIASDSANYFDEYLKKPHITYHKLKEKKKEKEKEKKNTGFKYGSDFGIYDTFFKEKGVPKTKKKNGDSFESPFIEIKKYTAWYWGSDDFTKPDINIESKPTDEAELNKKYCSNSNSNSNRYIKYIKSNNYYKIWTSQYFNNEDDFNKIKPFEDLDSNITGTINITILRAHHFVDEKVDNHH